MKKKKICCLVYKLLKSICISNQSNKEKTSFFLPIFAMQSFYIPHAFECLIAIIENYEELLLRLHEETINDEENNKYSLSTKASSKLKSSQTKTIRETKNRITELKTLQSAELEQFEEIEFFKKTKIYNDHYNSYISYFQEEDEISQKMQWDLISFFIMMIFQAETVLTDKKNLLKFLNISVSLYENGVNMNQELIYKYLNVASKNWHPILYDKLLIEIQTQDNLLFIINNENKIKLEEFSSFEKTNMEIDSINKLGLDISEIKLIPSISSPESKKLNHSKSKKKEKISSYTKENYLCDQFNFYSLMSNGRNYTWKKFLEENISYAALLNYLDNNLDYGKSNF